MTVDIEPVADLELIALEEAFADDCKCESRTHDNGKITCSGPSEYRLSSCLPSINVCKSMGEHAFEILARASTLCGDCYRGIEHCWTIRPI